jgi:hypothetical protein
MELAQEHGPRLQRRDERRDELARQPPIGPSSRYELA